MTDGEISFGTLIDVNARSAWAHEAHSFTPWLADNLDRLSAAIGFPIELTGREVGVGRYSADILAVNPADGAVILIENQLEPSDHTHLGQIMTYLAGLDAHVMIWLAPAFREEHLSAVRWLNQHTDENFSFFAVKLRVVQIADSPLAPLFEVLEKPNTWDKSLRSSARVATASAIPADVAERRQGLWQAYENYDNTEGDMNVGPAGSSRWRTVPGTSFVVSRYVSKNGVGLFLRGGRGIGAETTLPSLEAEAERLSALLGVELGNPAFAFNTHRDVDWADAAAIDPAAAWLAEQTRIYVDAASRLLQSEDPA